VLKVVDVPLLDAVRSGEVDDQFHVVEERCCRVGDNEMKCRKCEPGNIVLYAGPLPLR
jgi:hypothetical protein